MNTPDQIRFTQWVDGELSDDDVRDLLEAHPELRQERLMANQFGGVIRENFASSAERGDIPYADFFNNQVRQRIEHAPAARNIAAAPGSQFGSILASIFTSPRWVAGLAGGAAMMMLFLVLAASSSIRNYSEVVHTYTPDHAMAASSTYHDQAGVTVIKISGIEPLPRTTQISGYFPASSERDEMLASTTLYGSDRKPILTVSTTSTGAPSFHYFSHQP